MASIKVSKFCQLEYSIETIKSKLDEEQLTVFKNSCFGHFLRMHNLQFSGQLIHQLLMREVGKRDGELYFTVGGQEICFSKFDFCVITGLRTGNSPRDISKVKPKHRLRNLYIKKENVNIIEFENIFKEMSNATGDDLVKLSLFYFLERVLLSSHRDSNVHLEWLELVDNLQEFNKHHWGVIAYEDMVTSLQNAASKNRYTLRGFPYALQVWAYEVIPLLGTQYAVRMAEVYPLILNWKSEKYNMPSYNALDTVFGMTDLEVRPIKDERALEYFTFINDDENAGVTYGFDAFQAQRTSPNVVEEIPISLFEAKFDDFVAKCEGNFSRQDNEFDVLVDKHNNLDSKVDALRNDLDDKFLKISELCGALVNCNGLEAKFNNLDVKVDTHLNDLDVKVSKISEEVMKISELCSVLVSRPSPRFEVQNPNPLMWPPKGNLTLEWIDNLKWTLDWASRNLAPSDLPSILPLQVFNSLVVHASNILRKEPNLLRIDPCGSGSSVVVVGDLHGHLHDMLFILNDTGFPSQNRIFIFNGDFVDRGPWGLETFFILLACKVFMPRNVILHRGNHESKECTTRYGFKNEVYAKFGNQGQHVYRTCLECFKNLPLASIVSGRVFISHGGLFRSADNNENGRPLNLGSLDELLIADRHILDPLDEGLGVVVSDILWSDPSVHPGLSLNEDRGCGLSWGPDYTEKFLKKFNLKLIIRSHEGPDARVGRRGSARMNEGYNTDHEVASGKLVTVFSAPDYLQFLAMKHRYKNKGAYVVLNFPKFDEPEFHPFKAVTSRPKMNAYFSDEE